MFFIQDDTNISISENPSYHCYLRQQSWGGCILTCNIVFLSVNNNFLHAFFITMSKTKTEMSVETKNVIIGMFRAGTKPGKIANELSISPSTVYKFLRRFKQSGSIENIRRSGRPPKWTIRDTNQFSVLVKKIKKATVRTIWRLFNENEVNTVCMDIIRLKLKDLGMVRRCIKNYEVICWRNRIKRIRFAKTYRNWTVDDWKRVIFSDESQFVLGESKRKKIWRKTGEKYNKITMMLNFDKRVYALWCGDALQAPVYAP